MAKKEGLEFYSFVNDRQKALVNIYFTNNWLHNEYHALLKTYNVTAQQFNILKILNEVYPKSMMVSTIKQQMLDKSSDVTRLVERLLEKNLLLRRQDGKNRRKINVKLNIIGHSLVTKMNKDIRNFEGFTEHLSDKEIKQLNSLLNKIRKPVKSIQEITLMV